MKELIDNFTGVMNNKNKLILLAVLILTLILILSGCKKEFEPIKDLSNQQFVLLTQDSTRVTFPGFIKGKYTVMGFIFTNCPDICPLTTNNMRLIQEQLNKRDIKNVEFVSLSFDPEVDRPHVLKKYAELRDLDLSHWAFLTGNKSTTDSLIKSAGVFAVPSDTSTTPSGEDIIFYVHTDRIALINPEGQIIKNYFGSKINIEEIVNDIEDVVD